MYVYIQLELEPFLWIVGFYKPDGQWEPESGHSDREDAVRRAAWLNGSPDADPRTVVITPSHPWPAGVSVGDIVTAVQSTGLAVLVGKHLLMDAAGVPYDDVENLVSRHHQTAE